MTTVHRVQVRHVTMTTCEVYHSNTDAHRVTTTYKVQQHKQTETVYLLQRINVDTLYCGDHVVLMLQDNISINKSSVFT